MWPCGNPEVHLVMNSYTQSSFVNRVTEWAVSGISILNGMFGDYLQRRGNGLAIDMCFIEQGEKVVLDVDSLRRTLPSAGQKICVLVHGLCCNEESWVFPGQKQGSVVSYGTLLRHELGYTPFFVRYNTG